MYFKRYACLFSIWGLFVATASLEVSAQPLRGLLLSGQNNHAWAETTPVIQQILEGTGRFQIEVTDRPDLLTDEALKDFDVLISNWNTFGKGARIKQWPEATRRAYLRFVEQGKGHVVVHAGSSSFPDWEEYQRLCLATWGRGTGHGPIHKFDVRVDATDHPVTEGLSRMQIEDELWHRSMVQPNATVLASAHSTKDNRGTGQWEPIATAAPFGKGRSFTLLLGHNVAAMRQDAFVQLLQRGTFWAATGKEQPIPTAQSKELRWNKTDNTVALMNGEQVVWQFNHAPDLNKAYFHPVALPGGPTLTWDRPPDHVWHHGLWFSWKFINQINYWEIDGRTGKPLGRTTWSNVIVDTHDDFSAEINLDQAFIDPTGTTVMTGKRSVRISAPQANGKYHFDWTCSFTAGDQDVTLDRTPLPHEPGGKNWGGYAGLSVRLAKELADRSAVTAEGAVEFEQGRYRGKSVAMDYSGTIKGTPFGMAICDHPANLNHPSPWYTIATNPMSYFSPAVLCYKPFILSANQSLKLQYRVIVHPGRWDADRLSKEHERFVNEQGHSVPRDTKSDSTGQNE